MKTTVKTAMVMAAVSMIVSPALADLVVLTQPFSTGQGGAFAVELKDASSYGDLEFGHVTNLLTTFCVEGVTFSPGTTYKYTVDDEILNGTNGNTTLTATTKNLYAEYVWGTTEVAGFTLAEYVGSDPGRNKALQSYFWDLQGVTDANNLSESNSAYLYIKTNWANTNNQLASGVKALNLWSQANYLGDAQSHLVWVKDPGEVIVPAPGAALLAGLGLAAVGWLKRRIA